jgi:hypothetical protein
MGNIGSRPSRSDRLGGQQNVNRIVVESRQTARDRLCFAPCANPAPSVRDFWTETEHPAISTWHAFSCRIIEPMVNINLLKKWVRSCKLLHGARCESPEWLQPAQGPKALRVIDVKMMCISAASGNCTYACLSYIWSSPDESNNYRLSLSTLEAAQRQGGLMSASLPRTISDAIRLLQDMEYRYLWVDSLCIVQDDDSDMSIYLTQMDLIYAGAAFTIVVATGVGANGGIPHI